MSGTITARSISGILELACVNNAWAHDTRPGYPMPGGTSSALAPRNPSM